MAISCPGCGRQYDITLFQFEKSVKCDCGREIDHSAALFEMPLEGVLDLHTFRPEEASSAVLEYIRQCRERGMSQVRIVHGKGTGALRRTVLSALDNAPQVLSIRPAGPREGSWGATIVYLRGRGEQSG